MRNDTIKHHNAHSASENLLPQIVIWPLLTGIIALGAFLRFHQAGITPPGLHYDEAYYALDALRVLTDGVHPIFFEANNGREPLFIYLLAAVFRLFGPSQLAIRATAAVLGSLTIPAVYLLAKEVFTTIEGRFAQVVGPVRRARTGDALLACKLQSHWDCALSPCPCSKSSCSWPSGERSDCAGAGISPGLVWPWA